MSDSPAYLQKHILVCTEDSCGKQNGSKVRKALKNELRERDLRKMYREGECSCLGLCGDGVNAVIWPEGTFLAGVTASDVPRLVDYLQGKGAPLTDLQEQAAEKIEHKLRKE